MSGAYWDMRENLSDDSLALTLLLHSVKQAPKDISPAIALHAVTLDDDPDVTGHEDSDDDLSNGSPNYEKINAGFRLHDLATDNVAYVDIDWSGGAPSDPSDSSEEVGVAVTVDLGSRTLETDGVQLRYRINAGAGQGGAWSAPVVMGYRTQEEDYYGEIPLSGHAVGDVIDFHVRVDVTDTSKRYTSFPTQGQFDFSAGVEERDYFSVVVTNGTRTTALSNDLESDPSWDVTGDWEYGAPPLHTFGQTPGYDFPYDYDGSSPGEGPYCYFTDADQTPTDPYLLTTSAFDLTGVDAAVVSYAAWVFIRGGTEDQNYLAVEIGDGSNWVEIDQVTPSGGPGNVLQRWVRRRVKVTQSGQFTTGRKIRFSSVEGNGKIEAAIDEVRVWRVYDE